MSPESRAERRALWRLLVRLARPHRGRFLTVLLLAALSTGAELVEPLIYRAAVNDIAGVFVRRAAEGRPEKTAPPHGKPRTHPKVRRAATKPLPPGRAPRKPTVRQPHRHGRVAPRTVEQMLRTLIWAVLLLFLTNVATHVFDVAADNMCTGATNRMEEGLIRSTFGHVLRLPLGFFGRRGSGALTKRIDQSDQLAPVVTAFVKDIPPEAFRVLGIFAIMFSQSVLLSAVALATLPAYLLVARRSAKRLETNLPRYYGLWEEVSGRIQDAIGAIKTVKLSGAEAREVERLGAASGAAYASYLVRNRLANRYLLWQVVLAQLGKALVLGFGGWKALTHQLTPGDVVMFVAYLDRLYDPIDSLTSLAKTLQEHFVSLRRALRLLETGEEERGGVALAPGPGRVEFADVRFGYVPGREVIHGVTFTLEAGQVTALVGPSGAGKSTLVDLLLRLYEPGAGTIVIDGQLIAEVEPSAVRQVVSVVAADGAVFRGTLAENIRYKRPTATDEEVRDAAVAAGLGRALMRLPQGMATEVGEGGIGLSVGERQRLQLARALVAEPRILVLDEATANLDYATEVEVKRALARLRRGRTTLIVAHRYSMVQDADRVVVLDGGTVVESGTPAELIVTGGWFARMAGREEATVKASGTGRGGES